MTYDLIVIGAGAVGEHDLVGAAVKGEELVRAFASVCGVARA